MQESRTWDFHHINFTRMPGVHQTGGKHGGLTGKVIGTASCPDRSVDMKSRADLCEDL